MRKFRTNRLWQIIYPIVVYYLLYNVFFVALRLLFGAHASHLFLLGIASLLTIPFCYGIYKKRPRIVRAENGLGSKGRLSQSRMCCISLGVVALGLILNFIISHTPLVAYSSGYAQANATLYAGGLLTKIFANCISIPILEELVYRGIVCGQLSLWYDEKTCSHYFCILVLGIMHFNVVQFLYGFLVGLAIATVYIKTRKLWVVIVAHGLTNFIVVILASLG